MLACIKQEALIINSKGRDCKYWVVWVRKGDTDSPERKASASKFQHQCEHTTHDKMCKTTVCNHKTIAVT